MIWTAANLLDMVQELVGEPIGGFYNISQRLSHLSQAQLELVEETDALLSDGTLSLVSGTASYDLPADFLRFGDRRPYTTSTGASEPQYPLTVVPPSFMDSTAPGWREATSDGTPTCLVQEGQAVFVWPTPDADYDLKFNYVAEPTALTDLSDVPFNARSDLNRYGPALAYKVAFLHTLPRAPQLAQVFEDMYVREERKMRHFLRSNPQKPQSISPTARWSDAPAD